MVSGATLSVDEIRERLELHSFADQQALARTRSEKFSRTFNTDIDPTRGSGRTTEIILQALCAASGNKYVCIIAGNMGIAQQIAITAKIWAQKLGLDIKGLSFSSINSALELRGRRDLFLLDHTVWEMFPIQAREFWREHRMSDIAKAGVDQLIDVVDISSEKAIEAIVVLKEAAVDIVDDTSTLLIEEINETRGKLIKLLKEASHVVTEPLP